jgi:hypothetical protein
MPADVYVPWNCAAANQAGHLERSLNADCRKARERRNHGALRFHSLGCACKRANARFLEKVQTDYDYAANIAFEMAVVEAKELLSMTA